MILSRDIDRALILLQYGPRVTRATEVANLPQIAQIAHSVLVERGWAADASYEGEFAVSFIRADHPDLHAVLPFMSRGGVDARFKPLIYHLPEASFLLPDFQGSVPFVLLSHRSPAGSLELDIISRAQPIVDQWVYSEFSSALPEFHGGEVPGVRVSAGSLILSDSFIRVAITGVISTLENPEDRALLIERLADETITSLVERLQRRPSEST